VSSDEASATSVNLEKAQKQTHFDMGTPVIPAHVQITKRSQITPRNVELSKIEAAQGLLRTIH